MATLVVPIAKLQRYVNDSDTESVSLLEDLESDAVSALEAIPPGRTVQLDGSAVARVLDSGGTQSLLLPTPITSGSVTVRERSSAGSGWVSVSSSDFESRFRADFQTHELVRTNGGGSSIVTLSDSPGWPQGEATVEATYVSGYASGSAPGWVDNALMAWVSTEYRARVQAVSGGGDDVGSVQSPKFPESVLEMLERHQKAIRSQRPADRVSLA